MNIKRVLRRFTCLLIALAIILTYSFIEPIGVYAATNLNTGITGLSASFDGGTWNFSGTTLSGSVSGDTTSGCSGSTDSSKESSITLTNSSGETGKLSYVISERSLPGTGASITIGTESITATTNLNVVREVTLDAGQTLTINLKSGPGSSNTTTLSLSNISFVRYIANVSTTFKVAEHGSYTVDGQLITQDTVLSKSSYDSYTLVATPSNGYKLFGWYDVNGNLLSNSSTFAYSSDTPKTIQPKFIPADNAVFGVNGVLFDDLGLAITFSQNNGKLVYVYESGAIHGGSYTIPNGITLLVPRDSANTVDGATPLRVTSYSAPSNYRKLSLKDGAVIQVNSGGAISVASKIVVGNQGQPEGSPAGAFGQLDISEDSIINLENGSNLYSWGYITGSGNINAKSGSTVYEAFNFLDFRGGTITSNIVSKSNYKLCPFNQYYVQNIEARLNLFSGATEKVFTGVVVSIVGEQTATANFIGGSTALFNLSSGSLTKYYDPNSNRLIMDINGTVALNKMTMSIGTTVDTSKFVLPIHNTISIVVNEGSNINVNYDVEMLPGSQLIVEDGATMSVADNATFYFYDGDEWNGKNFCLSNKNYMASRFSPTRASINPSETSNLADALVDVNGSINVVGNLQTTESGSNITSTKGTGKIVLGGAPAEQTLYQFVATVTDSYTAVPVVPAKLHNDEAKNPTEPYTETAGSAANTTFTYSLQQGKWGNFTQHTVTFFDEDGTTVLDTLTVTSGDTISEDAVEAPEKEGYVFEGWFNGNDQLIFGETQITEDISYTARFAESTYTYGEPTYTWADDNTTCTANAVCVEDPDKSKTETATATSEITTEPTCETDGVKTFTATFTDEIFTTQTKGVVIPALEHNLIHHDAQAPTCTEIGWDAYDTCSRCDYTTYVEKAALGHDIIHHDAQAPTCTAIGWNEYDTCSRCDYTTYEEIPAKGHTAGEAVRENEKAPTCTEAGSYDEVVYCTVCSAELSRETKTVEALGHDPVTDAAVEPTCTETGLTEGSHCARCGEILVAQEVVPALDHDWSGWTETKAATCTEAGTETRTCSRCGETETRAIAALGHDIVHNSAVAATCDAAGNIEYWTCSRCGKLFSDADGTTETNATAIVLPALGHDWEFVNITWTGSDEAGYTAVANYVCSRDAEHTNTINAVITETTKDATCTEARTVTYTATISAEADPKHTERTDNKVVTGTALGHAWGAPTYEWAEDNSTVTATRICANDANHVETETANVSSEITKQATCEAKGETTYTAIFTNPAFTEQTKTLEDVPALGHAYGEPTYVWAEDNSTVTATRVCMHDASHVETETANTTADVTTPATCENDGVKTYTATFTNSAFAVQTKTENIPSTGHAWGEPTYVWAEDNSKVTATRVCANDENHVETETADAVAEVTKPATCEAKGETTYTATFANSAFEDQTKTLENVPAIGHAYGEPTYVWADDNSTVTATRVCANDTNHVETETAETTSVVTTPATCEGEGVRTYTATFTNSAFAEQTKTESIPSTGHAWGEPTYVWTDDNSTVTATRVCANDANHVETETVDTTSMVTKPATCETKGETTYTATFVNSAFADQTKTLEDIPAIGHRWDAPTYEWADDNSTVTAKRVCLNETSHVETETADTTFAVTTPATCETEGKTTYTATFTNTAFETQTREVTNIDALGHDWEFVDFTWTGNDEDGYTMAVANYKCKNNEEHKDAVRAELTTETTNATCTVAGTVTYTATVSSDAARDGEERTDSKVVTGQPLGHDYELTGWEWSEDLSSATVTFTCKNDSNHVETVEAAVTSVRTEPTCEVAGKIVYTATATFEGEEYTNSRTVDIEALGHDWETPTYEWAEDNSSVTATRVCANDANHVQTETVNTTSEVTTAATCETKGKTTYTATFTNDAFTTQTKVLENIDALGHDWGTPSYEWAEDNSSVTATRVCANDADHVQTETVNTTSEVTTAATCETKGKTTYTATFINEAFTTQTKVLENIDALGHDWDEGVVTTEPTCTEPGVRTFTCKHDSTHTRTEEIPATGHAWGEATYEWAEDNSKVTATRVCANDATHVQTETVDTTSEVTTAATCETKGKTTYTAEFENDAFETQTRTVANIDALGHNWGEWTVTTEPTCTAAGEETRTCSRCDSTETRPVAALGHTAGEAVEENRIEPTCTEAGHYDEVVYCSVCHAELSRVTKPIDALGHDYKEEVTAPTCVAQGYTTHTCSRCGDSYVDSYVEALGHDWSEWTVTTEPTCTAAGEETRTCSRCDAAETRPTAALGHDLKHYDANAATCTAAGNIEYWQCDRCKSLFIDAQGTTEVTASDIVTAALGHDYQSVVTAPTCVDKGYTTHTCSRCGDSYVDSYVDALGHNWGEWTVTTEPTCTEAGEETRTCSRCNAAETRPVAALGHTAGEAVEENRAEPTCTEAGHYDEVVYCSVCHAELSRETKPIEALGHDYKEEVTAPTCVAQGYTTHTCSRCGDSYVDSYVKALGHDWSEWTVTTEPTCTAAGEETRTCSRCDAIETRPAAALSHDLVHREAKAATCTEDGNLEYWTCGRCGKIFSDAEGATEIALADTVIKASGHTWNEGVVTTEPTCTSAGVKTFTCTTCGETRTEEITALGHTAGEAVEENRIGPTCTEAGHYDEVVYCSVCHVELSRETKTIAAPGHSWGEWTVTKAATCTEKGEETRTCSRCDSTETRATEALGHDIVHHDAKAPTCTEHGWEAYDECSRGDYTTYKEIPATGHSWGAPAYEWSADNSKVTAVRVCANDPAHKESETADTTSTVTAPTCTTDGFTVYTAAFKNTAFETQTRKVIGDPATGHSWGEPTYVWADDNSTVTAARVCANDASHTESETAEATAVETPATCETAGYTTYTAAFKNEVFEAQTKKVNGAAALGHDWDLGTVTTEPTCTTEGVRTYTCRNDSTHTRTEAIPAIGHNYGKPVYVWSEDNSKVTATRTCVNDPSHTVVKEVRTTSVVTAPTCLDDGFIVYTAVFEDEGYETQTKRVAGEKATGHDWSFTGFDWTGDPENGYTAAKANYVCKNDDAHKDHVTAAVTAAETPATCTAEGKIVYTAKVTKEASLDKTERTDTREKILASPGHSPVTIPAVAPTCEETGLTAGTRCSVCGEILEPQQTVPAIGHDYVALEPAWEKDASGNYVVTAKAVCSHDASHVITETVTAARTVVTEPTAETEGLARYTAAFQNALFETAVKDEPIPVLRYADPSYKWTETADGYEVTGTRTCLDDPSKNVTETVTAGYKVVTPAGCETEGLGRYTAAFTNALLSTQIKDITLPETGHSWGAPSYEWSKDNSKVTATSVCANDSSHIMTETADAAGTVTAPTCEEGGYTIYKASFLNGAFALQEKKADLTEALGHDWAEPVWKWEEDNTSATAEFVCRNDKNHTEKVKAEVTRKAGDEGFVYTAAVTGPDGKKYEDQKISEYDDILRIFGASRYETAFKNADKLKEELGLEKFSTIVVATGDNFPDSLSGAYLAHIKSAPILLINEKQADNVKSYIRNNLLAGGTVYVLGGEGVIKDEWLRGMNFSVKRLAGSTRYDTNLEVLKEAGYSGGDILIATGADYPDSLAGSSLDMPILLVKGDTLTKEQTAFLKGLKGSVHFYIAGGTGAVSSGMENALGAYGSLAKRFAGSNRYETSRMMAEEFFGDAEMAILAVGNNFPDGLSVGPLASGIGAPILLTNEGKYSQSSQTFTDKHNIRTGIVIGGPALISDETAKTVLHNGTIVLYE